MGEVVQFQPYTSERFPNKRQARAQAWVPVEFAIGIDNRDAAIARLNFSGVNLFKHRYLKSDSSSSLCMVSVLDAINANKQILEHEEISIEEIAQRIDLIQMLENVSVSLLEGLWGAISAAESAPSHLKG